MRFRYLIPGCIQSLAALPLRGLFGLFIKIDIQSNEQVRHLQAPFILASNHAHELDPLLLVASLPQFSQLPLIFVSRTKEFYQPMGWRSIFYGGRLFRILGALPAYPGLQNYDQALPHHLEAIAGGQSVCIFPLGKRHTDSDTGGARGGAAYLAFKTGMPILPVRITGIANLTIKDFFLRKCTVHITFGQPLSFTDLIQHESTWPMQIDRNRFEQAASILMEHIVALDTNN